MEIKTYSSLPIEAIKIRTTVFVEEQKFQNEFDEIDGCATHLVVFDNDTPIAACRFYCKSTTHKTDYVIGRIAVIKQYRSKHIGSLLLNAAELEIIKLGGTTAYIHAQYSAQNFYRKNGYIEYGNTDYDESCLHIWMKKKLQPNE